MYESTHDAGWVHGIDLAQEPDFHLGSLLVRPAICSVEWGGAPQVLQRRVMQVLVALSQAKGSVVSQDDLVIRCWRGLTVTDDAIFRCISKLRKLAASYPDAPFSIETIPGVGYRLSSSSVVEEERSEQAQDRPKRRFRPGAWTAAASLAIAGLGGALFYAQHGNAPAEHRPLKVMVQPFETLSNSQDARALARRIPNEVVDALGDSQVPAVLAGEQPSARSSGPRTASSLIVTGTLRDDAANTTVDVRVEDGVSREALWSTEFRRANGQTSDLPLEVAARIADIVSMAAFARSARPPLNDDSALSGLLQAAEMVRDSGSDDWAKMMALAKGVVARHPDFAFGHSILSVAYAEAGENISDPGRARAMYDASKREAELTLKLDPQDAGAYAVLSSVVGGSDPGKTEAILLRGLKYAKHPKEPLGALYAYESMLLQSVGRLREALSYQLIAQATDDWSPAKMAQLAYVYANMGNLDAAKATVEKAAQRWPNQSGVRSARRYVAGFYEPPAEALGVIDSLDAQSNPDNVANATWRSFINARAADSKAATNAAIPRIEAAADQGKIPRDIEVLMLAALGEGGKAIEVANRTLDRHEHLETRHLFSPIARNLRLDPAFVPLASRMGFIKYWRETGKRPDSCTGEAARTECSPQLLAALKP
ncbi:MAG TPA: winged helix-turn-helix domain-containing protein [Sphingomicrobium sp.]|nr:winged helix-turn-helix domain-containing protein [Sphingomicrobium sp.]